MDKTIKWIPLRGGLGMEVIVIDNETDKEIFRVELVGWGNGFGFKMQEGHTVVLHPGSQTVTVSNADEPEGNAAAFAKYFNSLPELPSIPEKDTVAELIKMLGWTEGEEDR